MGRTLEEVIASLPIERQERIEAGYQALRQEVESLRQLRRQAGMGQAAIAKALRIKQPSVSRIERQTDMYISTLRGYVEAMGGTLELVVHMPSQPPLRLMQLSDLTAEEPEAPAPAE